MVPRESQDTTTNALAEVIMEVKEYRDIYPSVEQGISSEEDEEGGYWNRIYDNEEGR